MDGNNKIILNEQEMVNAIQYYFDNVIFKDKVIVESVKTEGNSGIGSTGFAIKLMDIANLKDIMPHERKE